MAKFDDKTMYNFERYLNLQKSGELNMVSSEVRMKLGISEEEHHFILNNYTDLKKEFDDLKVVDEVLADAKQRANGDYEPDKTMGFNKTEPEADIEN